MSIPASNRHRSTCQSADGRIWTFFGIQRTTLQMGCRAYHGNISLTWYPMFWLQDFWSTPYTPHRLIRRSAPSILGFPRSFFFSLINSTKISSSSRYDCERWYNFASGRNFKLAYGSIFYNCQSDWDMKVVSQQYKLERLKGRMVNRSGRN